MRTTRTHAYTGAPIHETHTLGNGHVMTPIEVEEFYRNFPRCRHCGEPINRADPPRADQQTSAEVYRLAGIASHVRSSAGLVPIDCFVEHHGAFFRHVWFEKVGDALVERPYDGDDAGDGFFGFGVWPLVRREWA